MSEQKQLGKLIVITGPMFCSKTSELIRQLERYTSIDVPVLAINHSFDTRYGPTGLYTHNGKQFSGYRTDNLETIFQHKNYNQCRVVGIDESSFFTNLVEHVTTMVERDGKIVYVAGLNGTYDRKPFGEILNLIPLADEVLLLQSLCVECKDGVTLGIFTKLTVVNSHVEINGGKDKYKLVGGKDKYKPVCRRHFLIN